MRLWSIHPRYLDGKGLGGVWMEALLAQAVLLDRTRGWKSHPQLLRFKNHGAPIFAIGYYLLKIHEEADGRGYSFDKSKIMKPREIAEKIKLTEGQMFYELKILKERMEKRNPMKYREIVKLEEEGERIEPHPLFKLIKGDVEPWERSYWRSRTSSLNPQN